MEPTTVHVTFPGTGTAARGSTHPGTPPGTAGHSGPPRLVLLTVAEAAELLGISRAFAYELVARGELPSIHLGHRVVVPRVKLLDLIGGGTDDPVGTASTAATSAGTASPAGAASTAPASRRSA